MEIVTLSNGLKVGNFSSPHPFTFVDGSVLPAVSNEEAEKYKILFYEVPVYGAEYTYGLSFELSQDVLPRMSIFYNMYLNKKVDFVLCPLPMIKAIKDAINYKQPELDFNDIRKSPFRCVRMEDRIKKLASIDKFTM